LLLNRHVGWVNGKFHSFTRKPFSVPFLRMKFELKIYVKYHEHIALLSSHPYPLLSLDRVIITV